MKDLRSFPLVLAVLLVASLLAGARGFQGERVERPSPFEPGTRIPPAPADCPMAVMDRLPEEPRRLPQIAASPLGIPTELSAFQDPPAAGSLSQAGGPNAQQRRATLHGLSAGMERPAWTDGRFRTAPSGYLRQDALYDTEPLHPRPGTFSARSIDRLGDDGHLIDTNAARPGLRSWDISPRTAGWSGLDGLLDLPEESSPMNYLETYLGSDF